MKTGLQTIFTGLVAVGLIHWLLPAIVQAGSKWTKPFDIQEYRETIVEVTRMVESTNQLVASVGIEDLLPQLVKAIHEVGGQGQELVDHGFRQGVFFMLIVICAYVVGRLIYNFLNQRLIESRQ